MDFSIGFTTGNQFEVGKSYHKLGYIASASYKNETKFYEGAENNFYRKDPNLSVNELPLNRSQIGNLGKNNIIVSGLAGITYKTSHSKYKGTLMHIQNGESTAGLFTQELNRTDFVTFKKDNLEYTQRAITNGLLSGTHTNNDVSWKTEWKLSGTLSTIYDKDVRTTAFEVQDGNFSIAPNNEPRRIWRNLEEENYVGKLDFTKKYKFSKKDAKLKFGTYGSYKQRVFDIYTFRIGVTSGFSGNFNGDADRILAENNIWTLDSQQGSFVSNTSVADPANSFEANQINIAGYVSNEFNIGTSLKTIVGLRIEQFQLNYTGQNSTRTLVFDNESIVDKLDFFPSVNFIYKLTDTKNLRLSYSRTTARPTFKEASIAEIFDPLSGITFIGALANETQLKPTYINNLDMRFEFFGENTQMFAISGFYKSFTDPIELTFFQSAVDNLTPRNLGSADVYGIELELRKNLGFLSSSLKNLKFNINASIIESQLKIGVDELTLRQNTARIGEKISDTRDLQGQSPFLINAGLNYDNSDIGIQAGLFYNVQGKTLEVVGGINPDVYTMPYNSLNFTFNKALGKEKNAAINIKVSNLLGEVKESVYKSFNAQDQIFRKRNPGTAISIGYRIKF